MKPAEHPLASVFPKTPGDWAFGAGEQAVTFVSYLDEDYYVEHGLTYFKKSKRMALTPGHGSPAGERYRTFDPNAAILRCFQCHSTGPLQLAEGLRIVPSETGVQCEACHGPGSEHIRLKGARSAIRNPKGLTPADLNEFCGSCHRKPPAAGDDTNWNNAWNARHQPLYFSQSRCFTESPDSLSCLNCHPAHAELSRVAADYDRTCSSCHPAVKHQTPTASQSCVGCHMPDVKPGTDLQFANHWIGIYKAGDSLRPISRR
jgi:hypothetical protein